MKKSNGILILGASGMIGRYLFNYLNSREKVIGTYHENKIPGLIHFDITKSELEELPLQNIRYGIICSAITKLDKCKDDLENSKKVNIFGLERIISGFERKNILPIFFSSAAVFDGEIGNYQEEDMRNPITIYGEQKLEIENFLRDKVKDYMIIRPGKVFGLHRGEGGLFADWIYNYKNNEKIRCVYDETISPTFAGDVSAAIKFLIDNNARGIWHINPKEKYSRYNLAVNFFEFLGLDKSKIIKCSTNDLGLSEKRAKNTFLNSEKILNLGFVFTPLDKIYEIIKKSEYE